MPVEYLPNFYGAMPDRINGADDSDRLLVRWPLRDPAVAGGVRRGERRSASRSAPDAVVALGVGARRAARCAADSTATPRWWRCRADIEALRRTDPAAAQQWRVAVREVAHRAGGRRAPGSPASTAPAATSSADPALAGRSTLMKLTGVELRRVAMPLVSPFRTSFGTQTTRDVLLLRVVTDEAEGWGECVAMAAPLYSSEYVDGAADVLRRFLVPALAAAGAVDASSGRHASSRRSRATGWPRPRSRWASSTPSCAPRAARSRRELGAVHDRVPCGVSVGIMDDLGQLLDAVAGYLDEGYVRIKLKIEPGWDVEPVRAVRERFGDDVLLQVDANTAYTLADARHLARLDPFDLLLIEQPLAEDDLLGHAELARLITHAGLPGRVDHLRPDRRGRDPARRLLGRQHQARPGRRLPRGAPHPRPVRRPRRAGVVRRHARDRPRPRRQRRPRRAARASRCPATPRRPTATTRTDVTAPFVLDDGHLDRAHRARPRRRAAPRRARRGHHPHGVDRGLTDIGRRIRPTGGRIWCARTKYARPIAPTVRW